MTSGQPSFAVIGDTGPLLCAGGLGRRDGVNMLWRRYHGRIAIPQLVQNELLGIARRSTPLGRAAHLMSGRSRFVDIDATPWPRADREAVRAEIVAEEERRARRQRRDPKIVGHGGEIDAILLAQRHGALLLVNDRAAVTVARGRGIAVANFATILAAEVADAEIDAVAAEALCQRLSPGDEFDVGIANPTAQTIAGLPLPPGV